MMDRREMIRLGAGAVVGGLAATGAKAAAGAPGDEQVEQWGVFEASAKGPANGNPFVDVTFGAKFTLGHRTVEAPGFYDWNGVYKVRFSPDMAGAWAFET